MVRDTQKQRNHYRPPVSGSERECFKSHHTGSFPLIRCALNHNFPSILLPSSNRRTDGLGYFDSLLASRCDFGINKDPSKFLRTKCIPLLVHPTRHWILASAKESPSTDSL